MLCLNATCRHKPPGQTLALICNGNEHMPNLRNVSNLNETSKLLVYLKLGFSYPPLGRYIGLVALPSMFDL